jgi:cbb3-type cytochrome oxidase subunit 3
MDFSAIITAEVFVIVFLGTIYYALSRDKKGEK